MDIAPLKAALSDLERELESARTAKRQIESGYTHTRYDGPFWEYPEAALPFVLNSIQESLLMLLEASGLPETRQRLLSKWDYFEKHGGVGKTSYDTQFDHLESKPFEYIESIIDSIRT